MASAFATQHAITLKGSVDIIAEYFDYAINSILYQRGLYPPETFTHSQHYGLTILVTTDDEVKTFIKNITEKLKEWMGMKWIQQVVVIIVDLNTKETLERWEFKVEQEQADDNAVSSKDIKEIQKEIKNVIRQITASVTFLPLLDVPCAFDVLIYTSGLEKEVPKNWDETTGHLILNPECVNMKSFSTGIHKVSTSVFYKTG